MGVPSFFRWLAEKYPRSVYFVDSPDSIDMTASSKNMQVNPVVYDNLYLDGNGLIHPCCHPENGPAPSSEDEMIRNIFEYIDNIFCIIKPRRLLYLAIDGVAPRAKMNQQRARRFRSAQEIQEKADKEELIRQQWIKEGKSVPPRKAATWDHNAITPGTAFMHKLSQSLQWYLNDRITNDPAWKNITVVYSDASVPGEGEHKIMNYIRLQRSQLGYPPNMSHVLYGMDADLIMLALATHEVNFYIFRETVLFGKEQICKRCGLKGHSISYCKGDQRPVEDIEKENQIPPFQIVNISTLREYLSSELAVPNLPFRWNVESAIDDFIFLCFFVGNDFLPHLPSLDIREGALEDLILIYKEKLPSLEGFITFRGSVDLSRVDVILKEVGRLEEIVFKNRRDKELREAQRDQSRTATSSTQPPNPKPAESTQSNLRAAMDLKRKISGQHSSESGSSTKKLKLDDSVSFQEELKKEILKMQTIENPQDTIKYGYEEGWKERYYTIKFGFSKEDISDRSPEFENVIKEYIRGLCWVMLYYYRGCESWSWYYPYHYAPLASDLCGISSYDVSFSKSSPLTPIEQLMSVLPAASGHCLPKPYRSLMESPDSPVLDFYPEDFKLDLNGKKFTWQAVVLLPFMEESRLLDALKSVRHLLTKEELERDEEGTHKIYVRTSHPIGNILASMYLKMDMQKKDSSECMLKINGFSGLLKSYPNAHLPGEDVTCVTKGVPVLKSTQALSASIINPEFREHICDLLPGAQLPPSILTHSDILQMSNTRRFGGRSILTQRNDHQNSNRRSSFDNPSRGGSQRGRGGGFSRGRDNLSGYDSRSSRGTSYSDSYPRGRGDYGRGSSHSPGGYNRRSFHGRGGHHRGGSSHYRN